MDDAAYVWCLTRHLPGFHPAVDDAGVYPVLTEGLARFHSIVRAFPKSESLHVPDGICVRTRTNIDQLTAEAFVAFTSDPREKHILQKAAAWLLPRLDSFERLPRQIVHGDWTPRNVLFQYDDREMRLTGVLDFEAMIWDPACVDVANTCSTLLMWSGLDRLEERMESVVKDLRAVGGRGLRAKGCPHCDARPLVLPLLELARPVAVRRVRAGGERPPMPQNFLGALISRERSRRLVLMNQRGFQPHRSH